MEWIRAGQDNPSHDGQVLKKNGNEPSGSIRVGILDKLNVYQLVKKTHASRVNQLLGSLVMPLPDENIWFVKIRWYP